MLVLTGEIHDLRHLCLGNLVAEHPDDRQTLLVNGQHDFESLRMVHAEKPFQHMHDELHRGVVVIQHENLVKRRSLGFRPRLDNNVGLAVAVFLVRHVFWPIGHRIAFPVSGFGLSIYRSGGVRKGLTGKGPSMTRNLTTIAFDADDTLWHNERFFKLTQARFHDLLADFADPDHLGERLLAAEKRNIAQYGFGIKGFVLSMIETAIDVTEDRVPARVIREIIEAGQEMLRHPIELLPNAAETVAALAETHRVLLVTKGDLLDQERKLAQSGLGELFDGVEIVSAKTPPVYHAIFDRHGEGAAHAMMVGNSMKSDVIPVIEAGGWGVFVPHGLSWEIEHADPPDRAERYREIPDLGALPALVRSLD